MIHDPYSYFLIIGPEADVDITIELEQRRIVDFVALVLNRRQFGDEIGTQCASQRQEALEVRHQNVSELTQLHQGERSVK